MPCHTPSHSRFPDPNTGTIYYMHVQLPTTAPGLLLGTALAGATHAVVVSGHLEGAELPYGLDAGKTQPTTNYKLPSPNRR